MSARRGAGRTRRRTTRQAKPLRIIADLPRSPLKETHKWADYVELRCLAALDGVTVSDVAGWMRVDPQDSPEDPEGVRDDAIAQVQDGDDGESVDSTFAADRVDNRQRKAEDIFLLLASRVSEYGSWYPFELSENWTCITRKDELTDERRLYVFMLLCALGRYVVRHQSLTTIFERMCAVAIAVMLPMADVHIFGTSDLDGDRYHGGTLRSKIERLADDLGENPGPNVASISDLEHGDRGLDVVAWLPVGDRLASTLVVFAQAACTDEWEKKQDSPSPDAWDQLILVTSPAVSVCCIPHCYRDTAGGWHDQTKIHRRLLLDRHRLIHLLLQADRDRVVSLVGTEGIVDEVLAEREAL